MQRADHQVGVIPSEAVAGAGVGLRKVPQAPVKQAGRLRGGIRSLNHWAL